MKKTILCIAALSLIFASGCGKKEELVVAKVGDRSITLGAFEKASETIDENYLPRTSDLAGKKELLDVMINKEVMALKALSAGYEKEEWFIRFWERYKPQYVVAAMENIYVLQKVKVTEQEVKDYFEKMHRDYTLSKILVANEDEASSIREQLASGADFAELAKKYSLGPEGASGGELGSNAIGGLYYWIEDALFNMKEGDISQPLRTGDGWAILKVRRIQPITPEKDIVYARKKLEGDMQKRLLQDMKTKIEKDIGLVIYPDAVNIVYNNLPPDINPGDLISGTMRRDNAPKLEIPEQYQGMLLAQYSDEAYTLKNYMKIFNEMSLPERPTHRQGKESIVTSIHRRIWAVTLPVYAEKTLKVLDTPEVAKDIQNRKEMVLVKKLYDDQITNQLKVSSLEIQDYYNAHKNEIMSPERRAFSIILVGDKAKAEHVVTLAKEGEEFGRLAMRLSEDPTAVENKGTTGLVQKGNYPEYDAIAFSLPQGRVSDPFQVSRGWAVLRVDQIEAPKATSYAAVAEDLRRQMEEERGDKLLKEKLATWRKDYPMKIYERNLSKADLKRLRPSDAVLEQREREEQMNLQQQQALPQGR